MVEIKAFTGIYQIPFDFNQKKRIGIVGPNGVGKTTFFNILKRHQKECFDDHLNSFLDQGRLEPLGDYKVCDIFHMLTSLFPQRVQYQSIEQYELLKKWQFENYLNRPIEALSGGENQILKILTLFFLESKRLFLDEPTSHLDKDRLKELEELILSENDKLLMIIDHDKDFLNRVCHEIYEIQTDCENLTFHQVKE